MESRDQELHKLSKELAELERGNRGFYGSMRRESDERPRKLKKVTTIADQMELIDNEMKKQAELRVQREKEKALAKRINDADGLKKQMQGTNKGFIKPLQSESRDTSPVGNPAREARSMLDDSQRIQLMSSPAKSSPRFPNSGRSAHHHDGSYNELPSGTGDAASPHRRKKKKSSKPMKNMASQSPQRYTQYDSDKNEDKDKQVDDGDRSTARRYKDESSDMNPRIIDSRLSSVKAEVVKDLNAVQEFQGADYVVKMEHNQRRLQAQTTTEIYNMLCNDPSRSLADEAKNDVTIEDLEKSVNEVVTGLQRPKGANRGIMVGTIPSEIIQSSLVHCLSAFSIAEDKSSVYYRVKNYLRDKKYELPPASQIYELTEWNDVTECKARYVHQLLNEALKVAIHADKLTLVQKILAHSQTMRFVMTITVDELSSLIKNESYQMMIELIQHKTFYSKFEKPYTVQWLEMARDVDQQIDLDQTLPSPVGKLDQTKRALDGPPKTPSTRDFSHITHKSLKMTEQSLQVFHLVNQMFEERHELMQVVQQSETTTPGVPGDQDETVLVKQKLVALLNALCEQDSFVRLVPLLVLRGQKDLVFELIKAHSERFRISQDFQRQMALEFFCFAVNQEMMDEAVNLVTNYPVYIQRLHWKRCVSEVLQAMRRSSAFMELKLFTLSRFLPVLTHVEITEFLDLVEQRMLTCSGSKDYASTIYLQNVNHLRVTLQVLHFVSQVQQQLPQERQRVEVLTSRLIQNEVDILDAVPLCDHSMLIQSSQRQDLFGYDVLAYLAELRPVALLNTRIVHKIVEQYWKSPFFTAKSSLVETCSSFQVLGNNKIQSHAFGDLMCGRLKEKGVILAYSFPVWAKSIQVRYYIEVIMAAIVFSLMFQQTSSYLKVGRELTDADFTTTVIAQIFAVKYLEDLQDIEKGNEFVGYATCLAFASYIVLAFICKALLSRNYVTVTGTKLVNQQAILSRSQMLVILGYINLVLFFVLLLYRTPPESTPNQTLPLIQNFSDNLVAYYENSTLVFSYRFWCAFWFATVAIYFVDLLCLSWLVGPYMISVMTAINRFARFVLMWALGLILFGAFTVVWLGDLEGYETITEALSSLYLTPLGLQEFPDLKWPITQSLAVWIFHFAFLLVNVVFSFSLVAALLTKDLIDGQDKSRAIYNGHLISHLPVMRYKANHGWIVTIPTILSPLFITLIFPVLYLVNKCSKVTGQVFNMTMCALLYFPFMIAQLVFFVAVNLIMLPLAWLVGLGRLLAVNPYQENYTPGTKWGRFFTFLFVGPFMLLIAQFTDLVLCCSALYLPLKAAILSKETQIEEPILREKTRQEPVNLHSLQVLYQVMSNEVTYERHSARSVIDDLRSNLGIANCIKMIFLGTLHPAMTGSQKFMDLLKAEKQTVKMRLDCFNLLKKVVLSAREPMSEKQSDKWLLQSGLLFTYLQEIKMRVVAAKYVTNHSLNRDIDYCDFVTVDRSDESDELAREILVTCPSLVMHILSKGDNSDEQSKDDEIVRELRLIERTILQKLHSQTISQLTQAGASFENINEKTKLFENELRNVERAHTKTMVLGTQAKMAQLEHLYAKAPAATAQHLQSHIDPVYVKEMDPLQMDPDANAFDASAYAKKPKTDDQDGDADLSRAKEDDDAAADEKHEQSIVDENEKLTKDKASKSEQQTTERKSLLKK